MKRAMVVFVVPVMQRSFTERIKLVNLFLTSSEDKLSSLQKKTAERKHSLI